MWGEFHKEMLIRNELNNELLTTYTTPNCVYILVLSCLAVRGPESSCPSSLSVACPVTVMPQLTLSPTSALMNAIHVMPGRDEEQRLTHSHSKQWPPSTA